MLAAGLLGGLAIMVRALRRVRSMTARRQLRWIVGGTVIGGVPFLAGYGLPWAAGFDAGPQLGFLPSRSASCRWPSPPPSSAIA